MHTLKDIPDYNLNLFIRKMADVIEKYYEDPENQRRFEEWLKSRKQNQEEIKNDGVKNHSRCPGLIGGN